MATATAQKSASHDAPASVHAIEWEIVVCEARGGQRQVHGAHGEVVIEPRAERGCGQMDDAGQLLAVIDAVLGRGDVQLSPATCDANGDGKLDMTDVVVTARSILGLTR